MSAEKSQFIVPGIKLLGWVCGYQGRHPEEQKVAKLLNWPIPQNIREVCGLLGLTVGFRILIPWFQLIAEPLYVLMRKNAVFFWEEDQQRSFDELNEILSTFPVVVSIDYEQDPLMVLIVVDPSVLGWGACLMQIKRDGKRHPARYESGVWSNAEKKSDAGKRECRAVLKALRKFRHWVYGVHFTLDVDAQTLIAQLNRSATGLPPGALVTSWLAWIRLFDFTVKHVPGMKHTIADSLSRRPAAEEELQEQEKEVDIDKFVRFQTSTVQARVYPTTATEPVPEPHILEDSYSDEHEEITWYLSTRQKPPRMSLSRLCKAAEKGNEISGRRPVVFQKGDKSTPLRRVVDDPDQKKRIISSLHDEIDHERREGTYRYIAQRYWWSGLYNQVTKYCSTCFECQASDSNREEEALHPT